MTLAEKAAQLTSIWLAGSASSHDVAPLQHELVSEVDWQKQISAGLGQLTRILGTAPISAGDGARKLAELQDAIVKASRFGIPAIAHEECLNGLAALGATIYPAPLAWGATFDPGLVGEAARLIGEDMRRCGVHQGLAPVLDVVRDARWGRAEETIGEDPYLTATIATAYVRGLQSAGIIATLKHFAGYSASRAGRNFAPVSMGQREFRDVMLLPFEMAVRDGQAKSVMHAYTEIDGVPAAADVSLLTDLLRGEWGFEGTVVADYFGVAFLHTLHKVAASLGDAAAQALTAGVDVELPSVHCYSDPLLALVESGTVSEDLIDRACRRVLLQKCELGLLDARLAPAPAAGAPHRLASPATAPVSAAPIELDSARNREVARRLAAESIVLLSNDGTLPLSPHARVAVIGPLADDHNGMLGCYTFPRHLRLEEPGVVIPTLADALRERLPAVNSAPGCTVTGSETDRFEEAFDLARDADVCVVVLGDHAGLFGNGTSGEGCDVSDLSLPGVQEEFLARVCSLSTPIVLVLLSGRPYAVGAYADRVSAIVQAFFPGEEGGPAVADVLTGQANPSGRLPVSIPKTAGAQPFTYLSPVLGHTSDVSSVDPAPLFVFGHGLSYTTFAWEGDVSELECATDGSLQCGVTIRNTGERAGTEIVQLYLHDPVASVTRPVARLTGYARVPLEPGRSARVSFMFHADLASFTGRDGRRVVEPGEIQLWFGASSRDIRHTVRVELTGPHRYPGHERQLTSLARIDHT